MCSSDLEQLGDLREKFDILCTGGGGITPQQQQQASPATVHVGILSDEDLNAAYTGAVALVYPSKYEGFGLPVLEAMACGCPVVCSNAASLPEVGGEAPLYVDLSASPDMHATLLAAQLRRTLEPSTRIDHITRGIQQARSFSWTHTASQIKDALLTLPGHTASDLPVPDVIERFLPPGHLLPSYEAQHPLYDRFLPTLASHLPEGSWAIDVGANCGDTLIAMGQAHAGLNFLCVEPDMGFQAYLTQNARSLRRANPKQKIELVRALVGQPGQHGTLNGFGGSKQIGRAHV